MLSIGTDEAVQMLQAGWTVRYCAALDAIEWRSPDGMSGSELHSESLDKPPLAAVRMARRAGQISDRARVRPGPR
jgi:hypothetical protein